MDEITNNNHDFKISYVLGSKTQYLIDTAKEGTVGQWKVWSIEEKKGKKEKNLFLSRSTMSSLLRYVFINPVNETRGFGIDTREAWTGAAITP